MDCQDEGVTRAGHSFPSTLWKLVILFAMLALGAPSVAAGAPSVTAGADLPHLPESDYTTHSACSAPAPGRASCMALELVARTAAARARVQPHATRSATPSGMGTVSECAVEFPSACLTPQDLHSAYFPSEQPQAPASSPQTVALVDAYNDPKVEADLGVYDEEFGLPPIHACSGSEGGCLERVSQSGTGNLPFPREESARETKETFCLTEEANENRQKLKRREEACDELVEAEGWDVEIATDVEVTHAVCQNCKILLVEASADTYPDLEAAEETAVRLGATEISNSWGGPPEGYEGRAFDHPGTVITAAAGDDGYLNWTEAEAAEKAKSEGHLSQYLPAADYPAISPDVVAVGGTKLTLVEGVRQSETVWNEDPDPEGENEGAGGGGCSESFTAPPWQQAVPDWSQVGCGSKRAVADVSADADPYTGVAIYDSVPTVQEEVPGEPVNAPLEWWPIGGTSVASPLVASMFALAGGAHGVAYPAQTLYSHLGSPSLNDVTSGGNGDCDGDYVSCSGSMDPLSPLDCGKDVWICNATTGYDGPTGVGTPNGLGAFQPSEAGPQGSTSITNPAGSSDGASTPGSTGQGGSGAPGVTPAGSGSSTRTPMSAQATPRISALVLTANARASLRHAHPRISSLGFSCMLSRATSVRVTLAIQVHSASHTLWHTLHTSLTFAAIKGANHRRLNGSHTLAAGLYRLTLTPAGGAARSLTIRVP
jgi:hypothetical protein